MFQTHACVVGCFLIFVKILEMATSSQENKFSIPQDFSLVSDGRLKQIFVNSEIPGRKDQRVRIQDHILKSAESYVPRAPRHHGKSNSSNFPSLSI